MARPTEIDIVKHVTPEDLNMIAKGYESELQSCAKSKRIYERICFVRMRYKGYSVEESASAAGMTMRSGYNIQELWNRGGADALIPNFGGGRPPRMTSEQKDLLKDLLAVNPMETGDVRLYISEEFGIPYSMKQVHVILTKMGLHHAKPYPADHRRPDNAEDVLKKDSNMVWTV
ncbi:MAG: helix-turn-helix domain-containing protein [Candidatus Methanoplasma sp.]|jgi:putative transposase|nr:helix-turn-helix domain-containing protein [Candidatus Methanoplasma sp.]